MMRIVAGEFKGQEIISPSKDIELRPTSDRVREAIFDVIRFDIQGKVFVDLFAGSGAVGIEALSEGAFFVYFVEKNPKACSIIKKNILRFNLQDRSRVYMQDVFRFIASPKVERDVDFVFLDPPYKTHFATETLEALKNSPLLKKNVVIIAEHSEEEKLGDTFEGNFVLKKFKEKRYGKIVVSYYVVE
jgi:16S rRNA (guanine(966)-N(2))-methyltransferase RsmD